MREISFRAWNKEEKFLDTAWSIDFEHGEVCHRAHNMSELDDCILMQYTGLEDVNGVEIYEGDILRFKTKKGYEYIGNIGVICWSYMAYVIGTEVGEYLFIYLDESEVIGNIYENPELLEVNE